MPPQRPLRIESLEDRRLLSSALSNLNATLPMVISTTPSLTSGAVAAGTQILAVGFNVPVLGGSTAGNYELRFAGPDGLLGTADDAILPLSVTYGTNAATLTIPPLTEDIYRLTVRDTITDTSGNKLDGDGDGVPGGNWVREFVVTPTGNPIAGNPIYPTGGANPYSVISGDFNGDGVADLAVADGCISILLGAGGGRFSSATTYASGGGNQMIIVAGDFNGDGKLDLAVANANSNNVGVLLGNGNGTFSTAATFSSGGSGPHGLATGDFNGDGKLDLAVANYTSSTVCILLGNGSGGFTPQATVASGGTNPYSLAVGDFNGDGLPDVAVANSGSNNVGILAGNGSGGLAAATTFATLGASPAASRRGTSMATGNSTWSLPIYPGRR